MSRELVAALVAVGATLLTSVTNYVVTGYSSADKALTKLETLEKRIDSLDTKIDTLLGRK